MTRVEDQGGGEKEEKEGEEEEEAAATEEEEAAEEEEEEEEEGMVLPVEQGLRCDALPRHASVYLPSRKWPSDHLCIACDLVLSPGRLQTSSSSSSSSAAAGGGGGAVNQSLLK